MVRGLVMYGGSPQPGVKLRIGTAGRTKSALSDEAGRFSFPDLAPGAYALMADLPEKGLGQHVPVDVGLTPEPAPEPGGDGGATLPRSIVTELTVELQPTARVVGLIRDDAGRPLPGAFVRVEEENRPLPVEVETGADGRFAVEGRMKGQSYRVSCKRAGFIPDGPRLAKAGGPPLELRLQRGAILTGSIVDEHGAAIAGAELAVVSEAEGGTTASASPALDPGAVPTDGWARLEPGGELGILRGPIPYPPLRAAPITSPTFANPSRLPLSDARGQFRIAELTPGQVIVTARHPDFAAAASVPVVLTSGSERTIQLVLLKGASLRGRTVDDRGAAIADAEISSSDGRTVISDGVGRWELLHLTSSVRLTARHAGFLKAESTVELGPGQRELTVEITLARALGRLGGQVVDVRGNPVEGARVSVTPRGGEAGKTICDRSGRFLVEGLPDGPYRVEVEATGWPRLRLPTIEASAEARLVLDPGGGVEGELFDSRSGVPPSDARIELVSDGDRRTLNLEGRRFRAVGVPTGPAKLVVRARGYARTERELEILAADRPGEVTVRDVRIELELGGQVRGRVRDDRGEAAAGAEVELVGAALVDPARVASDGTFALSGVPSGRVRLRARLGARVVEDEVEVRPNEESRVDLTLPQAP